MTTGNDALADTLAGTDEHGQIHDPDDAGSNGAGAVETEEAGTEGEGSPEPSSDGDDVGSGPWSKRPSGSARLKEQNRQLKAELEATRQFVPRPTENGEFNLDALVEREIGPAPQEKDFTDFLDYQAERAAWLGEKRRVGRELRSSAQQASVAQLQEAKEIIDDFKERAEEVSKRIPDLKKVLSAAKEAPNDPGVIRMLLTSEKGPELAYFLSKNQNIVQALNAMRPLEASRELGRLESRLSSAAPKNVTKAPEPVPALKGGIGPSAKDPGKMSMRDYTAWRKSGGGD